MLGELKNGHNTPVILEVWFCLSSESFVDALMSTDYIAIFRAVSLPSVLDSVSVHSRSPLWSRAPMMPRGDSCREKLSPDSRAARQTEHVTPEPQTHVLCSACPVQARDFVFRFFRAVIRKYIYTVAILLTYERLMCRNRFRLVDFCGRSATEPWRCWRKLEVSFSLPKGFIWPEPTPESFLSLLKSITGLSVCSY